MDCLFYNQGRSKMRIPSAYSQATYPGSLPSLSAAGAFGRSPIAASFTYKNTPYINALNSALQLEHVAVALYAAKQRTSASLHRSGTSALNRTDCHYSALRQLIGLIFAQRGLPDSDPSEITALTSTMAAKVSRFMPPVVQEPVLGASAQRVELALARRYRRLLNLAPDADRLLLTSLLTQTITFC